MFGSPAVTDGWVVTKRSLVEGCEDLNCRLSFTLNANLTVSAAVQGAVAA